MKTLFLALTTLLSATAFASASCPNLAGNYQCTYQDENGADQTYEQQITQSEVNGVTTYTSTSEGEVMNFIADGQTRTNTNMDDGYALRQSLTVACAGSSVHINSVIDAAVDESFADVFYHGDAMAMVSSSAQTLDVHTTGTQWYFDEKGNKKEEAIDMMDSCTRL